MEILLPSYSVKAYGCYTICNPGVVATLQILVLISTALFHMLRYTAVSLHIQLDCYLVSANL